jgi:hypothetical protein
MKTNINKLIYSPGGVVNGAPRVKIKTKIKERKTKN